MTASASLIESIERALPAGAVAAWLAQVAWLPEEEALALVVYRRGDSYVARALPWTAIAALKPTNGRLTVRLADARPVFAVNDDVWPPKELV